MESLPSSLEKHKVATDAIAERIADFTQRIPVLERGRKSISAGARGAQGKLVEAENPAKLMRGVAREARHL